MRDLVMQQDALLRLTGTLILDQQAAGANDEQSVVNAVQEWDEAELRELADLLLRGHSIEEIARLLRGITVRWVVGDRPAHAFDRRLRAVPRALFALSIAERIVVRDLPERRLVAAALPVADSQFVSTDVAACGVGDSWSVTSERR